MEKKILEFANILRKSGISVSTAETIDSFVALDELSLEDREIFKDALRTTMVKRGEEIGTFDQLFDLRVILEGMLLKPNMVLPGKHAPQQASVEQVAEATLRTLRRTVPAAVPGVVFLSGGQTPEQATAHLNAMNAMHQAPWELSFSYGRALQDPTLKAWRGQAAQTVDGQRLFYHRSRLNSAAREGKYSTEMEKSEVR